MRETRDITKPQVGFWMVKLVKGGTEIPACIRMLITTAEPGNLENAMERSGALAAFIGGKSVPMDEVWLRRGRPITASEYERAINDLRWSLETDRSADPLRPINHLTARLPF